jgi:hypothetical protein
MFMVVQPFSKRIARKFSSACIFALQMLPNLMTAQQNILAFELR